MGNGLEEVDHLKLKNGLNRMTMMLSKLDGRGFTVEEDQAAYRRKEIDFEKRVIPNRLHLIPLCTKNAPVAE